MSFLGGGGYWFDVQGLELDWTVWVGCEFTYL